VQTSRKRLALLCVAAVLGSLIASKDRLRQAWFGQFGSSDAEDRAATDWNDTTVAALPSSRRASGTGSAPQLPAAEEAPSAVYVAAGLRLIRETDDGRFLGYRVVENASDSRFSAGDIITRVGGEDVEDSAAGSERLIAQLLDKTKAVEIREP
jgi:hypothetical protein